MTEFSKTFSFANTSALLAEVGVQGGWSGLSSFVVAGVSIERNPEGLFRVAKYVGRETAPQDIKRLRRSVHELMRRMGQPVIVKHKFNDKDAQLGIAEKSPSFNAVYGQVRNEEPLSWGTGYVSVEKATDEWIGPQGQIIGADVSPGSGYIAAPKYRGYGPGYLTYIIEPDVAEDLFKESPSGALIHIQQQTVQAPWYPEINDNDLLINVTIDHQWRIVDSQERYEAKMTNPISIRGLDRRGRREYSGDQGNRHLVNQNFEMSLVPDNNVIYRVEIDR